MTPLMFGPPSRRLFGLFHAAEGTRASDTAVLLCPPMGHEALRSHRFYRLLALRLSRRGVPVLRFDPYGTGDSPGDDEDGDLDGWRRDIGEAHRELVARSGASRIVWFGARIGATLALQAAASASPRIARLVLWEPVLEGPGYLAHLREKHVAELELSHAIPKAEWRRSLRTDPEAFATEAFGFGISEVLRRQIMALTPDALQMSASTELVVIAKPDDTTTRAWVTAQTAGQSARHVPLLHSMIWTSNPHPNNEMVPAEALRRVMAEIHE
ncbi:alpha/beta fold hydrolase [Variovorax sp. LT1P1]|uniref:alpha/beta fold hydrolase n=1 Tax=Variovorax sp. LT1P1 TaxID=3443730 RepID=UPI003F47F3F0